MSITPDSQRASQKTAKNPRDSMDTLPTGAAEEATPEGAPEVLAEGQLEGGEGNVLADRRYREGVKKTLASGEVEELAEEASKALDGEEGEELRAAEERGRRGQHR